MSRINLEFPLEIVDLEPQLNAQLLKYFTGEYTGFVKVGPKGYCLPHKYKEVAARIYNAPLRETDTFVVSYPRSGTTWTMEMVWLINNNLDYRRAVDVPLLHRFNFLEFSTLAHSKMIEKFRQENMHSEVKLHKLEQLLLKPGIDKMSDMPSPRHIMTHLPLSLMPPALVNLCKVVYIARDPRDVAVSFYHLNRLMRTHGYIGDFKTYWKFFTEGLVHWTPYFEHILEAWKLRSHKNMLFLFYEDMIKDLPAAVKRISAFYNKNYSETQVLKLCEHLSFENFKKNPSVNFDGSRELGLMNEGEQSFIRKGKAGGWRDYFDEEMTEQAELWLNENLHGHNFSFPVS